MSSAATPPPPSATPSSAASASTAPVDTSPPPAPPTDDIGQSNQFAARGFVIMAKKEAGNVFVSPPSLRLALGMTFVGAEKKTAEEMASALGFDADPKKVAAQAKAEIAVWRALNGKDVEIAVANRLWGDKAQPFEKAFLDATKEGWGAPLEPVDFRIAFEPARKTINTWVKKETKDKIPDLLPPGSVNDLTRLVLTNAVYFNGKWSRQFDKKDTRPGPFTVPGAPAPGSVPMMHKTARYKYAEQKGVKLIELPYGKGDIAMVIALPDTKDGLPALEAGLSYQTFSTWRSALTREQEVALTLPPFEFSFGGSVKEALRSLGIQRAFTDQAEFDKIARKAQLRITDVFHKTYVKVNESGTEAAAATGVVVGGATAVELSPEFVADHPFLFYLHDTKTGRVLFIGQLLNPADK